MGWIFTVSEVECRAYGLERLIYGRRCWGECTTGDEVWIEGSRVPARFVGISPAGIVWVAYDDATYEMMVRRSTQLDERDRARDAASLEGRDVKRELGSAVAAVCGLRGVLP